ncbi:MAG: hypothetical protein ACON35_02170 [Candidatus Marinamargulisbacteria bacterium]
MNYLSKYRLKQAYALQPTPKKHYAQPTKASRSRENSPPDPKVIDHHGCFSVPLTPSRGSQVYSEESLNQRLRNMDKRFNFRQLSNGKAPAPLTPCQRRGPYMNHSVSSSLISSARANRLASSKELRHPIFQLASKQPINDNDFWQKFIDDNTAVIKTTSSNRALEDYLRRTFLESNH